MHRGLIAKRNGNFVSFSDFAYYFSTLNMDHPEEGRVKGRGAQYNPHNRFQKNLLVQLHFEGIDEVGEEGRPTEIFHERPKNIVNRVESPDIPLPYSMNPYQGCEHGCVYCYARPSHEYWGLSAGLDFERKIIVKENAAELLAATFDKPNWKVGPIMLSGNTDCYQPIEREWRLTRQILQVCLDYQHPIGVITKNNLILRDLDILKALAEKQLVHTILSITSLNEDLRRALEPRTSTTAKRLGAVQALADAGIPVMVMAAPIIPGLNSAEIPALLKAAADAGAYSAGYTMVRLNGATGEIFAHWLRKTFPDRASKVLSQIAEAHGGKWNDSRFGTRMRGEGKMAEAISRLFRIQRERLFAGRPKPQFRLDLFQRPPKNGAQLALFG